MINFTNKYIIIIQIIIIFIYANMYSTSMQNINFNFGIVVENNQNMIYDNLTYTQLVDKIDRILNSDLSGKGKNYVDLCLMYDIDPYLAVAISLLETGCKWKCSLKSNNVGGNMHCNNGSCKLKEFDSIEEGIEFFIKNLKNNYYDYGLNTPELIGNKYASSKTWATKVNDYIEEIKRI